MKLDLAMPADAQALGDWAIAKVNNGYMLRANDLAGTILKVEGAFFIAVRKVMFLGPLIPNPAADGKTLTIALHRMVKDIRKTFDGDIVYLNYEENGVDQAARAIGKFEEVPDVTVKTEHGTAKLMILRGGANV